MKSLLPLAVAALVCLSPAAGDTLDTPSSRLANIHFTLTVLDMDSTGKAIEQVVETLSVAERGAQAHTHAGWKVPIPVGHHRAAEGEERAATSYVYQDVGLDFTVEVRAVGEGSVRASGQVEISGVDRRETRLASTAPAPQIGTFSHRFQATLLDGAPTSLVTVPKPDGGSVRLTLTATLEH